MPTEALDPMTIAELLKLPASLNFKQACRALGISENRGRRMIADGKFPVPVKRYGGDYAFALADILRELSLDPALAAALAPAEAGAV
jgi:predicted DNA-binding transcriptional regulator AlpA